MKLIDKNISNIKIKLYRELNVSDFFYCFDTFKNIRSDTLYIKLDTISAFNISSKNYASFSPSKKVVLLQNCELYYELEKE